MEPGSNFSLIQIIVAEFFFVLNISPSSRCGDYRPNQLSVRQKAAEESAVDTDMTSKLKMLHPLHVLGCGVYINCVKNEKSLL
jgi:hypothetical protein